MNRLGAFAGEHIVKARPASDPPPGRFRGIGERVIDWANSANRDDSGFGMAGDNAVIMRSSRHAAHETPGWNRLARAWIEIRAAVTPPNARQEHTETIGRISVRRAHITGPLANKGVIEARRINVAR